MSVIPDSSSAGNSLVLKGAAEQRKAAPNWDFVQKLVPQGTNARHAGDKFGDIASRSGDFIVVGTPTHPYHTTGDRLLNDAGSVWVFQRTPVTDAKKKLRNVTQKQTITSTQNFVVPQGARTLRVKMWGAAGGSSNTYYGGSGAYVSAILKVTPGETLNISIGKGGTSSAFSTTNANGGIGGGYTAIMRGNTELVAAGSGGGAGRYSKGGYGGGIVGESITYGYTASGGTPTAAGTYSTANFGGSRGTGGGRYAVTQGSGGAGYWGGSGVGYYPTNGNYYDGGGAGGSSFIGHAVSGSYIDGAQNGAANNASDPDYVSPAGKAGRPASISGLLPIDGGDGLIVLSWVTDELEDAPGYRWDQIARIVPLGTNARNAGDHFGASVSMSENFFAVGAPDHSYDATGSSNSPSAGAVFMYKWDGVRWTQHSKLIAPSARFAGDQFGSHVHINGGRMVVGAVGEGAAYVFKLIEDAWTFEQKLTPPALSDNADRFGSIVRIELGRIVVSAPNHQYDSSDANPLNNAGAVYVYELDGQWKLITKLVSASRVANGGFGSSLDLKGNAIIVGSPSVGRSEVFKNYAGTWDISDNRKETGSFTGSDTLMLLHLNSDTKDAANNNVAASTSGSYSWNTSMAKFGTSSLRTSGSSVTLTVSAKARIPASSDFTFEFWWNPQQRVYSGTSLSYADPKYNVAILTKGPLSFSLNRPYYDYTAGYLTGSIVTSSGTYSFDFGHMAENTWHHIVVCRSNNVLRMYRNGAMVGNAMGLGSATITDASSSLVLSNAVAAPMLYNEIRLSNTGRYSGVTFTLPTQPFRAGDSVDVGRGASAALIHPSIAAVGLPMASGFNSANEAFDELAPSKSILPSLNVDKGGLVQLLVKDRNTWSSVINLAAPGLSGGRYANDKFGTSVRIRQGRIIVGAPQHGRDVTNQTQVLNAGAAYVYEWNNGKVKPVRKLVHEDRTRNTGINFGQAVDINGDRLSISAPSWRQAYYQHNGWYANSTYAKYSYWSYRAGHVLFYKYVNDSWLPEACFVSDQGTGGNSNSAGSDNFIWPAPTIDARRAGTAIASLHRNLFVFSDPSFADSTSGYAPIAAGSFRTAYGSNDDAALAFTVTTPPGSNFARTAERLGYSVATDGTYIVAGAPNSAYDANGLNLVANSGAVYVVRKTIDNTAWAIEQKLVGDVRDTGDQLGTGVDLRNGVIIAGGPNTSTGLTTMYTRGAALNNSWSISFESKRFQNSLGGQSVALVNGTTAVVGIPNRTSTVARAGEVALVLYGPKPVVNNGVTLDDTNVKFGSHSAAFASGAATLSVKQNSNWRFGSKNYTIEFWIKTKATGTATVFSTGAIAPMQITLRVANGKMAAAYMLNTSQQTLTGTTTVNDDNWHHIAFTKFGNQGRLYVDGVHQAVGTLDVSGEVDSTIYLGGSNFAGNIDDLRIYDTAKYTGAVSFAVPTEIPVGSTDPLWDNCTLALNFNGNFNDLSNRWWMVETPSTTDAIAVQGFVNARSGSENFGYSVSLGNNLLAIGSPGTNYIQRTNTTRTNVGAVDIYEFSSITKEWFLQTRVNGYGSATGLGNSLHLNGNTLVTGNPAGGVNGYLQVFNQTTPGNWVFQGELLNTTTASVNTVGLGRSVAALDDNTIIGGASSGDANVVDSGIMETYTRSGGTWTSYLQTAVPAHSNGLWETNTITYTLLPRNASNGRNSSDRFGNAVCISEDKKILAIGATAHRYNADGFASSSGGIGAVFFYYWDSAKNQWRYQSKSTQEINNIQTGANIITRGDYFAVLANNQNAGNIDIYVRNGEGVNGSYNIVTTLKGNASGEYMGQGMAFADTERLVMGSRGFSVPYGSGSISAGGFRTSTRSNNTWSAPSGFTYVVGENNIRSVSDFMGRSVAVWGDKILIGGHGHRYAADGSNLANNSGAVLAFKLDPNTDKFVYTQKITPVNTANGYFGWRIDMRGDTAVVCQGTASLGHHVLSYDGSKWTVPFSSTGSGKRADSGAVIDDSRVIIGNPAESAVDQYLAATSVGATGSWRPINREGSTWNPGLNFVTPSFNYLGQEILGYAATRTNNRFGYSVSLNENASLLAVGSPYMNSTESSYSFGSDTGSVLVFAWDPVRSRFVYHSQISNPRNNREVRGFGYSVDLKGNKLLVGAGTTSGNHNGSVFVYNHVSPTLWNMEYENVSYENFGMGKAVAFAKGNSVLVTGMTTHGGFPFVSTSGRVFTQKFNSTNGSWTSLDTKAGGWGHANTYPYDNTDQPGGGGGGGSGAVGGAGGTILPGTRQPGYGGHGGTNLVPPGGAELIGVLNTPPMSSDTDRGTAGTGGIGNNPGAHGRVVISWNDGKQIFDYTGSDQTFIVPATVTNVDVKMWGAGGGGGLWNNISGGAGGYVQGTLPVTPGERLTIMVGQGGTQTVAGTGFDGLDFRQPYGGGGIGGVGRTSNGGNGANGGGRVEILRGATSLAIAAGGGGAGGSSSINRVTSYQSHGQPGGSGFSGPSLTSFAVNSSTDIQIPGDANGRFGGDYFGFSVALDTMGRALVGAPNHSYDLDGRAAKNAMGAVFIFARDADAKRWSTSGKLISANPTNNSRMGTNLQIRGNRMIAGSWDTIFQDASTDINASGGITGFGTLEFFKLVGDQWLNDGNASGTSSDWAYRSATIVGDNMVVTGMPLADTVPGSFTLTDAGAFETIQQNNGTWQKVRSNVAPGVSLGRNSGDTFGSAVKLADGWLAVGAMNHRYNLTGDAYNSRGAVFVFRQDLNTGEWLYDTKLVYPTSNSNYLNAGISLHLIDRTLISKTNSGVILWSRGDDGSWTTSDAFVQSNTVFAPHTPTRFVWGSSTTNTGSTGQPIITNAGVLIVGHRPATSLSSTTLTVPGASNGRVGSDRFGTSVYAGPGFIAVGAPNHAYGTLGVGIQGTPGAIFTYTQPGGSFGKEWRFEQMLLPAFTYTTSERIGARIVGMGNYITSTTDGASIEVFQRVAPGNWKWLNTWRNLATAYDSNTMSFLTMPSDDKFVIGTPQNNPVNTGVMTFTRNNNTFSSAANLLLTGTSNARNSSDQFGYAVAANKNFLVVGAPWYDYNADGTSSYNINNDFGAVFVYAKRATGYDFLGKVVSPSQRGSGRFGASVAIDDEAPYFVVGEPQKAGRAYVYKITESGIVLHKTLSGDNAASNNGFGGSVAINNGRLVVGDSQNSGIGYTVAGGVWVFRLNDAETDWTLVDIYMSPASGTTHKANAGDNLGASVAVSSKGAVIMGAPGQNVTGTVTLKYYPRI